MPRDNHRPSAHRIQVRPRSYSKLIALGETTAYTVNRKYKKYVSAKRKESLKSRRINRQRSR